MRILYLLGLQPLNKKWKMVSDLLPVEYPVDHMTAKQPHLDLVASVRIYLGVLMNRLKYIRCSRPI